MRVLTVVGNRPQFVKAAAVSDRLRTAAREVLVHTGQHYDDELSRVLTAVAALRRSLPGERPPLYGDGRAGERVVTALRRMAE